MPAPGMMNPNMGQPMGGMGNMSTQSSFAQQPMGGMPMGGMQQQ